MAHPRAGQPSNFGVSRIPAHLDLVHLPFRVVAGLEQDAHEVVGVLAEEPVGVDDVVELAPLPPLPGERPQGVGLAGSRLPVPEEELASARRLEAPHQRDEPASRVPAG